MSESQALDLVVLIVRSPETCAECKRDLRKGDLLRREERRPLCLDCADLGHLKYLPRGNPAVTRRAAKYSPLHAVVLKWSSARKRNEPQGLLVLPEAIRCAEEESLADEDLRAQRRERERVRSEAQDREYVTAFAHTLTELFPGCPPAEAEDIARRACEKHSGRIGRSADAKGLDPDALRSAVRAHIRHQHTQYEQLLTETDDRFFARSQVRSEIERILAQWKGPPSS